MYRLRGKFLMESVDPIIMTSLNKIHFLLVMRFRLNDMKTNFDQTLIINLS